MALNRISLYKISKGSLLASKVDGVRLTYMILFKNICHKNSGVSN